MEEEDSFNESFGISKLMNEDLADEESIAYALPAREEIVTQSVRENLRPRPEGKGILPRQDIIPEEDLFAKPFYEVCSYDKIYITPSVPITKETAQGNVPITKETAQGNVPITKETAQGNDPITKESAQGFIAKIREKEDSRECQADRTFPALKRKAEEISQYDSYDEIDPFNTLYDVPTVPLLEEIEKISCSTIQEGQNLGVVSPVLEYSEGNITSPQLEITLDSQNTLPLLESTLHLRYKSPRLKPILGSRNTSPQLDCTLASPQLDHTSGSLNISPRLRENLPPEETTTEARSVQLHSPQTKQSHSHPTPAANSLLPAIAQKFSSSALGNKYFSPLPGKSSCRKEKILVAKRTSPSKMRPILPANLQSASLLSAGLLSIDLPSSCHIMTTNITGQANKIFLLTNSVGFPALHSAEPGAGPSSVWKEAPSATRGKRTLKRVLQVSNAPMSSDAQAIADNVKNPSSALAVGASYVSSNLGKTSATRDLISESSNQSSNNSSASFSTIERSHGNGEQYQCQLCDLYSDDRKKFVQHLLAHENIVKLQCRICGRTYYNSDTLRRHLYNFHKIRRAGLMAKELYFNCKACSEKFTIGLLYIRHLIAHVTEHTHKCDKCTCSYSNVRQLDLHKSIGHP